jgi:hypothetical protein
VARLIGGPVQKNKEKAAKASPLHHVTKDAAPFLIMHGDQDNVVPLAQSVNLAEALRRAGVEVTLRVYNGSGYGDRAFHNPENWKLIEDFFARHLRAERATVRPTRQPQADYRRPPCERPMLVAIGFMAALAAVTNVGDLEARIEVAGSTELGRCNRWAKANPISQTMPSDHGSQHRTHSQSSGECSQRAGTGR